MVYGVAMVLLVRRGESALHAQEISARHSETEEVVFLTGVGVTNKLENSAPSLERGYYRHCKGDLYTAVSLAFDPTTDEWVVVYRKSAMSDNDPIFWVRPYDMFFDEKEPGIPRFKFICKD